MFLLTLWSTPLGGPVGKPKGGELLGGGGASWKRAGASSIRIPLLLPGDGGVRLRMSSQQTYLIKPVAFSIASGQNT